MFSMKKTVAILGAGAMLVSVAACGNTNSSDNGGKKEISFQTWNLKNDKYTPYFEELIKAYEKDHPDVTIKWLDAPSDGYEDKLSSQAASGQLPDIVDGGNSILYGLAKAGALLDVSKEAPDAQDDYYEGAWEAVTMQGNGIEKGAYGLPWYVNDGPTYWNTELMSECGLDPNNIPTTWDEYFAAGDAIVKNCKDKGIYLGITMGYNAEDLLTAGVKSFMNSDHSKYTFNDEAGVKQLTRFVDLYKAGGIPPEALDSSWSQAADLFQRGNLVAMAGSAYSAAGFKQNAPDLYDHLAVGPRISDDGRSASLAYEMLGISAQSKHPDVAIDFARFVTNAENQVAFDKQASVFPSAKGGLEDEYFSNIDESTLEGKALKITLDQVKNGYGSRPAEFTDNNGYKNFQQQIALAMQGKQTPKEALDKSVEFANEKLAQ
ncbi:sugar ABC transporter substrate-binding protein [Bifidobacterium reuteri]|uniref:ABC superfamily ATP binding cassette transporter, solute-binding protein n=2 Tax=Bifidobacterium reuteri TaxID=983706 RepID=A0A087CSK7_9BIFI|nr:MULTISPECIES: sugar ABC transporter substrate-binding protein [Bifidobacterium]KAA8825154.1 sugar ABC transporter substrate-binding protein [Bifidobacterium reuteri]KFI86257.1 ABC superfamily ATP binding cassette transporter, solute-binding protein [Bifidobacterium reuteri DSM 23975]TPF78399.1 ABC transporter substrate-binding protein [Bifidobacterium sp. UTCIF-1]TPF81181.1 ABC transporter substrate-binding protein [Bifidobacterium sp. UTCIF-24]TPF81961.1 ABC transporter substrate-binding p